MCDCGQVSRPTRRIAVNLAAWLGGAVVSVGVGVAALAQINDGLAAEDRQPLNRDTVASALPDPPAPTTAAPTPTSSQRKPPGRPSPAGTTPATARDTSAPRTVERGFTSRGGSVVARCTGGQVYLASWSPAPGYHAEHVERGPAESARLTFESGNRQVTVEVGCVAGVPQAATGRRDAGGDHSDDR
jgi:phage tail protein X